MKYLKSKSIRNIFPLIKSLKIRHGPYGEEFLTKYFTDTCNILNVKSIVQNIYSHCSGTGSLACKSCDFRNDRLPLDNPSYIPGSCSLANRADMDILFRNNSVSYNGPIMCKFIEGLNRLRHMCVVNGATYNDCKECSLYHGLGLCLCNGRANEIP